MECNFCHFKNHDVGCAWLDELALVCAIEVITLVFAINNLDGFKPTEKIETNQKNVGQN